MKATTKSSDSLHSLAIEEEDSRASSGKSNGTDFHKLDTIVDKGSVKLTKKEQDTGSEAPKVILKVVAAVPKYTSYYAPNYKCLSANDLARLHQSKVPIPENEAERIFALRQTDLLDSDRDDPLFDRFTALAQRLFDVPIALVSLVDIKRQWFKSAVGLDAPETHRDAAFCAYTVLPDSPDVLVVEDATLDNRFKDNVLVTGPPFIRFYAGAALIVDDVRLGSLCIIDIVPHEGFTTKERMNLLDLGVAVSSLIKDRKDLAINASKQSATMILDMLTSISFPLLSVNEATQVLLQQQQQAAITDMIPDLNEIGPIPGSKEGEIEMAGGSGNGRMTPKKPETPKPSGTSAARSRRESATSETNLSTVLLKRELQHGLGRLNVLMECSLCFGKIIKERAERPFRYAGFRMTDVLTTVTKAQNVLKQLTSGTHPENRTFTENSNQVVWDVGMTSIKGAVRHLCPPQVLFFAIVSGVEMMIDDWRKIHITLKFKEVEDVEYDALVDFLEKYNTEEEYIEESGVVSGGEKSGGQWKQGLYSIEFRVFDKILSPSSHPSPIKGHKDTVPGGGSGAGSLDNSNHNTNGVELGSKLISGISVKGNSNSSKSSKILARKLKALEQVLVDSGGGLSNELSSGGMATPPTKHTLSGKREEGLLECWVPFAIYQPAVEMLDTVKEEDDDEIVAPHTGSDGSNTRSATASRNVKSNGDKDNNSAREAEAGDEQGGVAATAAVDVPPVTSVSAASEVAASSSSSAPTKTKEGAASEGQVAAPTPSAQSSSGGGRGGGGGGSGEDGKDERPSLVAVSSSSITTGTTNTTTGTTATATTQSSNQSSNQTKKVLRLLFVDDSTTVQRLMSKWLKSVGCVVTLASNGKIALNLLKTKEFDVCFMDFLMPVMSGIDAIEKFHEWRMLGGETGTNRDRNKEMLMVGFSETSTVATLTHVFAHGCHFFCRKPPETHILSTIISLKRDASSLPEAFASIRNQTNIRGCDGVIGLGHTLSDIATALGENRCNSNKYDSSFSAANRGVGKDGGADDEMADGTPTSAMGGESKSDLEIFTAQAQAQAAVLMAPATAPSPQPNQTNLQSNLSNAETSDKSQSVSHLRPPPMYVKASSSSDSNNSAGWRMFTSLTSPFGRK